jgi:hypothetical protein
MRLVALLGRTKFGYAFGVALTLSVSCFAQSSLTIGNIPGYPGAQANAPVTLNRVTNVTAAQFDVSFDSARVSSEDPSLAPALVGRIIKSREVSPGVRRLLMYSLANTATTFTNNRVIAHLPFTVLPAERYSSGPITPSNVILANRDGNAIPGIVAIAGQIFIRPVNHLPDGTVQFFLPSEADERYLIQASTNLINWVSITNLMAPANFMDLIDVDAARHSRRFYRWVLYDAAAGELGGVLRVNGNVRFQVNGLPARTYVIEASTNLLQWTSISTNTAAGGVINFSDPQASQFRQRFYRLRSE